MKTVRAKFLVNSVTAHNGGSVTVNATPVGGGSDENKSFSKYTPSGKLELYIDKETPAHTFFEPGKSYYIDFSKAD